MAGAVLMRARVPAQSDSYLRRMLPWNTVSFDISAVGDMPGLFEDELVLLFDGEGGGNVKSVTFPLSAAMTGSPLQFDDTVVGIQARDWLCCAVFGLRV